MHITIYTNYPTEKLGMIRVVVGRYYENTPSRTEGSPMDASRICDKYNITVTETKDGIKIDVPNSKNEDYKTIDIPRHREGIRHATHVEIGQVEKGGDSIYISVMVDKSAHVLITDRGGAIVKHTEADLIENEFKERRVVWEADKG